MLVNQTNIDKSRKASGTLVAIVATIGLSGAAAGMVAAEGLHDSATAVVRVTTPLKTSIQGAGLSWMAGAILLILALQRATDWPLSLSERLHAVRFPSRLARVRKVLISTRQGGLYGP